MYRRIEFIQLSKANPKSIIPEHREDRWYKSGLMGFFILDGSDEQADLFDEMFNFIGELKGVGTGKNNRYYFTELGWEKIGRKVIEYAQKLKMQYRIIKIKENSVDVMATDNKYEVAVRPRKNRFR